MHRRGVAFFDFDDTLIHGDSLPRFIAEIVGPRRMRLALADAIGAALRDHLRRRPGGADFRGSVKAVLVKRTLAGVGLDEARDAARRLARRLRWHAPMVEALHRHRAVGDRVVIATGALDVYMPALLGELGPLDDLLATAMEVRDGTLTGRLGSANCVRHAKAARVADWIRRHGPFACTTGYGNRPSDLPMLALVNRGVVVKIGRRNHDALYNPEGILYKNGRVWEDPPEPQKEGRESND